MIKLIHLFADHGTILQFLGEDLDTGDVVVVSADYRPGRDIFLALKAEEEVLVSPEPWAVRTLQKAEAGR